MSWFDDIQVLALHAVVREDGDYNLRSVFRWYSKTFATPLHVVETLPIEDVLRHYFEAKYEDLEEEHLAAEIKRLATPPETALRQRLAEDADDAEVAELAALAPETRKVSEPVPDPLAEKLAELRKGLEGTTQRLEDLQSLPEGITMTFDEDEQSLGPPPGNLKAIPQE